MKKEKGGIRMLPIFRILLIIGSGISLALGISALLYHFFLSAIGWILLGLVLLGIATVKESIRGKERKNK